MKPEITLGTPGQGLQSTTVFQQQEFPNCKFTTQSPGPCIAENLGVPEHKPHRQLSLMPGKVGAEARKALRTSLLRSTIPGGITHAGLGTECPNCCPSPKPTQEGLNSSLPGQHERKSSARGCQSNTGIKVS